MSAESEDTSPHASQQNPTHALSLSSTSTPSVRSHQPPSRSQFAPFPFCSCCFLHTPSSHQLLHLRACLSVSLPLGGYGEDSIYLLYSQVLAHIVQLKKKVLRLILEPEMYKSLEMYYITK